MNSLHLFFNRSIYYILFFGICSICPVQPLFGAANDWHVDGPVAVIGTNAANTITTDPAEGLLYAPMDTVDPNGVGDTLTFGVNCANDPTLVLAGDAFLLFGAGDETNTTANINGAIQINGINRAAIRDSDNGLTVNIGSTGSININAASGSRAIEALGFNGDLVLDNAGTITSNVSDVFLRIPTVYAEGNITVTNTGSISTSGILGGAIETLGSNLHLVLNDTGASISTSGNDADVLFAEFGAITIDSNLGTLSTTGNNIAADGVAGVAIGFFGVSIGYNDGNMTTQGSGAVTLYSQGGSIDITTNDTNGVISTQGSNATAINAENNITIGNNAGQISTQGNSAAALFSNNGNIEITTNNTGGVISTAGDNASNLFALNGGITVGYNDGEISTQGTNSYAFRALNDIQLTTNDVNGVISTIGNNSHALSTGGGIILGTNHGEISTLGNVSYAILTADGINITENSATGTITTMGDNAVAIYGGGDVTMGLNNGTITTDGSNSHVIFSTGNFTLTTNGLTGQIHSSDIGSKAIWSFGGDVTIGTNAGEISTAAGSAPGPLTSDAIRALNDISITTNSGTISTSGAEAAAIYSDEGDIDIETNSGTISTLGDASAGIVAVLGDVVIGTSSGSITTGGTFANPVRAGNDIIFTENSGTISTTGTFGLAFVAGHDILLETNSGSIITQGADSDALVANNNVILNTNTGTIATTNNGATVIAAANNVVIGSNQGTISSAGDLSPVISANNAVDITNEFTGVIEATGTGNSWAVRTDGIANGLNTIINRGQISTASSTVSAIQFGGNTNDTILHEGGTIGSNYTYSIEMGDGDDLLTIRATEQTIAAYGAPVVNGIMHGGSGGEIDGDTIVFDFVGICLEDYQNLGESGTITHWGQTYSWEEFENVVVNALSFVEWAETPNQIEIAEVFDCINEIPAPELVEFIDILVAVGEEDFPEALNQLSPQRYEIFSKIAFNNHDFMLRHLNNRSNIIRENATDLWDTSGFTFLDNTLDPKFERMTAMLTASKNMPNQNITRVTAPEPNPTNNNRFGLFLSGNAILAEGDGTPDIYDYEWDTYGVVVGGDYQLFPGLALGVMGGYSYSDVKLDHYGSDAEVESYMIGTYLNWWWQHFYINGMFSYGLNEYEGRREVPFVNNSHHFDTDGTQLNLGLTGGYDFHFGPVAIGPTAGVRYVDYNMDGFTEEGDGIDRLTVYEDDAESLRTSFGAKANYTMQAGSLAITHEIRAAWGHEFLDDSRGLTARFNSSQLSPFTVETTDPERDWAELGGSVRAKFNQTLSAFIDYDAQVGQDDFFAHSVQGGLRLDF